MDPLLLIGQLLSNCNRSSCNSSSCNSNMKWSQYLLIQLLPCICNSKDEGILQLPWSCLINRQRLLSILLYIDPTVRATLQFCCCNCLEAI